MRESTFTELPVLPVLLPSEKKEWKKEEKFERRVETIDIKSKPETEGGRFNRQRAKTTAKTK